MRRALFGLALLPAFAAAACSTAPAVNYTKVATAPIPESKTVALNVDVPEGEKERSWRTARRKIRSTLDVHLSGTQTFQDVRKESESADYRLDVAIADVTVGQAQSKAPETGNALANYIAQATTTYNDGKRPDQIRDVEAYVTLVDAASGAEISAFKASGSAGSTDATVAMIVQRIVAGLRCHGEECA